MTKDNDPIGSPHLIPVLVGMLTAGLEALQLDTSQHVIQIMFCTKRPAADGTPNAIVLASCPQEEVPELLQRALDTLTRTDAGDANSGKFIVDTDEGTVTEQASNAEIKAYVDDLFKNLPKGPAPSP